MDFLEPFRVKDLSFTLILDQVRLVKRFQDKALASFEELQIFKWLYTGKALALEEYVQYIQSNKLFKLDKI